MTQTPADFVPSFAVYVSEMATKPMFVGLGTQGAAKSLAEKSLRKFVIRRSHWTVMGERPNGMVVYTQR